MSLQIHFRLTANGKQFPTEYWLGNVAALVDYYLNKTRLTCCDFQAGYCIDVGGKRWNGDKEGYDFDEPWMTMAWLDGLIIIFGSSVEKTAVPFWEQSNATLKRVDKNILEIEDMAAHAGGGICAPTWVDADAFAEQIIIATRKYLELCEAITKELLCRVETVPKEKIEKINSELDREQFLQKLNELEEVKGAKL